MSLHNTSWDLVAVGTGFATTFFLKTYLENAPASARILILERGRHDPHAWQVQHRTHSSLSPSESFYNPRPEKPWVHTPGFGGGSNCWWACTPRFLPNDFRMHSVYGVGRDWPISYDDLEPFYAEAETLMNVSGPSEDSPFRRSAPYPQAPHRFSDPDRLLKAAFPTRFFHQPCARNRQSTAHRPRCCATGSCGLCPINAKFTIPTDMQACYEDPRVTLLFEAEARELERTGNRITHVNFRDPTGEHSVRTDLVALGANALFNPFLLLRSGFEHPLLGRGLHEQTSLDMITELDGVDNFQGSTSVTGHGYMLYDGEHRRNHAGCLIETWNVPQLRNTRGRWRQILKWKCIFEVLPDPTNRVQICADDSERPEVVYHGFSDYTQRALDRFPDSIQPVLEALPVETVEIRPLNPTESHILGTVPMGDAPESSVVDADLIHHQVRNLLVLGGSAFPVSGPSNPTLTISALSLRAARRLTS